MTTRKDCLPVDGCQGGFHWLRYSGTPTIALWKADPSMLGGGLWESFGGREFEPTSKLGRAHTYLGPIAAWNRRALPSREEIERVIGSHVRLEWRGGEHASLNYRSTIEAADAVLALLGSGQ